MLSVKKPSAGFYITVAALVLSLVSFIMYFATFNAFHYVGDRWIVALMIIAMWSMICILVNALLMGDKPFWVDILYIAAMFALVISAIKFITPCLSPIGIYFTVNNMGDVEANALGVPRSIAGIVIFVLAIVCLAVAAFFNTTSRKGVGENGEK